MNKLARSVLAALSATVALGAFGCGSDEGASSDPNGGVGGPNGGSGSTDPTNGGTTPTPPPNTTPPSAERVDNPYIGAIGYLNEDWAAKAIGEANKESGPLKAAMLKVAAQPSFVWLDRIGAIAGGADAKSLEAHLDAALAQQTKTGAQVVFEVVIYNLPNRDCNALASNGELLIASGGMARYKAEYIDVITGILARPKYATLRIATVIEVDSLPNLVTNASVPKCQEAAGAGGYVEGVRYALDKLATVANVYNYVDVGHSGWLGWDDNRTKTIALMKDVVEGTAKKWNSVAGFVTNSANYTPLEEPNLADPEANVGGQPLRSAKFYEWNRHFDELDYATAMRTAFVGAGAPERLGMLIDTGRNGWGGGTRPSASNGQSVDAVANSGRVDRRLHRGNWCNQAGAGVGELPKPAPKPGIHAYVWVKPAGESDGIATPTPGGPNADGKQHDPMCAPEYVGTQQSNGGNKTGALPGAPHAGAWFPAQFKALVENAYPAL